MTGKALTRIFWDILIESKDDTYLIVDHGALCLEATEFGLSECCLLCDDIIILLKYMSMSKNSIPLRRSCPSFFLFSYYYIR